MRERAELESSGDERGGLGGVLLCPLRPRPRGDRYIGDRSVCGGGLIVVSEPGVRLMVSLLASMIFDVTCWG